MPTATIGSPQTIALGAADALIVSCSAVDAVASVAGSTGFIGAPYELGRVVGETGRRFGPYGRSVSVIVSALAGSITAEVSQPSRVGDGADAMSTQQGFAAQGVVSEAGITTWANRASVLTAGLSQAFFTDLGPYGSDWLYTGGRWRPRSGRVVLKNLVTSVSNSAAPKVVMDYATVFAGLLLDGDALEIEFQKTREGGTSDTDTTDVMIGSAALTLGTSTGLSTGALATTTIQLAPHYEIVRMSATSVRTSTLPGGVGLGSASSLPTTTTGLPNMDTLDTYLQVTSDLTTAGGEVAWLRKFRVTLVAGS